MSHVNEWVMSRMNESCQWVSHVTHEWVMLTDVASEKASQFAPERVVHLNESCRIWMRHDKSIYTCVSHVTYRWVMLHPNKSYRTWPSHDAPEYVVLHVNESCHRRSEMIKDACINDCYYRLGQRRGSIEYTCKVQCAVLCCGAVCCIVWMVRICILETGMYRVYI